MKTILIITGPTACGKTSFAINCAKRYNGEIISCDSMQIYKDLDIGTAKPTINEQKQVKHYLIDIVKPNEEFSVQQYVKEARNLIDDISHRGKLPIIVGGTGLYLKSLIYPYSFCNIGKNEKLREYYNCILKEKGKEFLYELLKQKDFNSAKKIHINDTKRVIRALEIYDSNKVEKSKLNNEEDNCLYNLIFVVLNMERDKLYQKINDRVDSMIENGLVDEISFLIKNNIVDNKSQSMQAIGYREFFDFFNNKCDINTTIEKIKQNSRHYAKRQITFLKSFKQVAVWFDIEKNEKQIYEYIDKRLEELRYENR